MQKLPLPTTTPCSSARAYARAQACGHITVQVAALTARGNKYAAGRFVSTSLRLAFYKRHNFARWQTLPHGVLFRGSAESTIRQHLIEELNYLDTIIGLPANFFYGTSIPTCILVFKKCRKIDKDIVFIDASGDDHFIKNGNQNELRDEYDYEK